MIQHENTTQHILREQSYYIPSAGQGHGCTTIRIGGLTFQASTPPGINSAEAQQRTQRQEAGSIASMMLVVGILVCVIWERAINAYRFGAGRRMRRAMRKGKGLG